MRNKNNHYITTCFALLLEYLHKAYSSVTTFTVIDGVRVNRIIDQPPEVIYDSTQHHFKLENCRDIIGNFSADAAGYAHNASLPGYALSKAQDLFYWSANTLSTVFNNTLETATVSSKCQIQSVSNGHPSHLTCDNTDNDLAIVYPSGPYRSGFIGVANPGGLLTECLNGLNGFIIAGYQSNEYPTSSAATPSHYSTFSMTSSTTPAPTITTSSTFSDDTVNLLWVYVTTTAVLLAGVGMCLSHKGIRNKLKNCFFKVTARRQDDNPAIPLDYINCRYQAI